jgi:hypothetical protein
LAGLSGLADVGFLVLREVVHVEVVVGFEPVLWVSTVKARTRCTGCGIGEDAHDISSVPDLLVETFEHVRALEMLMVLALEPAEGERLLGSFLRSIRRVWDIEFPI